MKGIVKLDDGWAAFCCECEKELTRGHCSALNAWCPIVHYVQGQEYHRLHKKMDGARWGYIRTYCSATCKTAGEKRRNEMEKGKEMWRVVDIHNNHVLNNTISKTQDEAIEKIGTIVNSKGNRHDEWRRLYEKGYRVESFTPEPEIDWEEVTFECMDQKNGWGNTDDCAFCNATKEHPKASFHCQKCPLQAYAESINVGNKFRRCVNLGIKKATAMGLTQNDKFSRHVFPSVLADFLVWYESGGMDKK